MEFEREEPKANEVEIEILYCPPEHGGGSRIGNLAETREMLNFCAEHGITTDLQKIKMDGINGAYKKVEDGEVRFRHVIDRASLTNGPLRRTRAN